MAQPPNDDSVIEIDCEDEITYEDMHRLKVRIGIDSDDVRLIDEALKLLCKQPKWVFKDAEIGFLMQNHCYTMHSGARTNRFLILFGEFGQAEVNLRKEGWKLFVKEKTMAIWNWACENPEKVIGLVQLLSVIGGLRAIELKK